MIAQDKEYWELSFRKRAKLLIYNYFFVPFKVWVMRRKSRIDTVFLISELGVWKTENLYLAMLGHARFSPHIAVIQSLENRDASRLVEEYLTRKGYDYVLLSEEDRIYDFFTADIIFYQKPYWWVVPQYQRFGYNWHSLFCYVTYGFWSVVERWSINQALLLYAWQVYMENSSSANALSQISHVSGRNFKITGIPIQDAFLNYKEVLSSPWKAQDREKKRIIWAPHHTIPEFDRVLCYSTFGEYCYYMLSLADKYKDEIQVAFKPHPLLRPKLEKMWGEEKTSAYFEEWSSRENTQVCEGEYLDLMMTSDALVHDCGSFTIEYQYTHKPALYLDNGMDHKENLIPYAAYAYDLHYKAKSADDIDRFICDVVIFENDSKAEAREEYIKQYLTPVGNGAIDNIINAIIGK